MKTVKNRSETAQWNAIFEQLIKGWHTGALRY